MDKKRQRGPKVAQTSPDLLKENIQRLKELFPGIESEGKINFSRLKQLLGDEADDRAEKYSFTWAGKRDAIRMLQAPSRATLIPAPEESVNFDTTNNIFIEGENLEVLKLLYKSYAGRVKMIYIDPPYNTGQDFIYPDNFADPLDSYLKITRQKDSTGNLLTSNPETSGRFHSAWLSMMYPRLFVARQLLREDGVIFISIDDNEASNLRLVMNEIFGEDNFKADICWQKRYTRSNNTTDFTTMVEHILVYAKSNSFNVNLLPRTDEADARYSNPDNDPRGPWKGASFLNPATPQQRPNLSYPIKNPNTGELTKPTKNAWRRSRNEFERLQSENLLYWGPDGRQSVPVIKMFLSEARGLTPTNFWSYEYAGNTDDGTQELEDLIPGKVFNNPKPTKLIRRMLEHASDKNSIILDFFSGSCVTAQAVLDFNKNSAYDCKFVMVQLPEPCDKNSEAFKAGFKTIAEIGKERIRRIIAELKNNPQQELFKNSSQSNLGFKVFKLTESNYRQWNGVEKRDGNGYAETMEMFTDPLTPGWKPTNVIYEVAIKEGYSLNIKIERLEKIKNNKVFLVTDPEKDQSFRICLDPEIKQSAIKSLDLEKDDLFICRDTALSDELAANLALQCKLKTI